MVFGKAMISVRESASDLSFNCSLCESSDDRIGQQGGRLVKTSCPSSHVFHLECITKWLDSEQQAEKSLNLRECSQCKQPLLPLIPLGGSHVLDEESPYCESLMLHACRTGNLTTLNWLLAEDETLANRTYRSALTGQPESPLAVAIQYCHHDCVRALVESGAVVNTDDHDDQTPLHLAARSDRTDCSQMLNRAGANIIEEDKANDCFTPLHGAAFYNRTDTVTVKVWSDRDQSLDFDDLHFAIRNGNTKIVKMLLVTNPSLAKAKSNNGRTALHLAALEGNTEAIQILLATDPSLANAKNNYGNTALHLAALEGHTEAIQVLLAFAPSLANAKNNYGNTALHLAAHQGHTEATRALLAIAPYLVKDKDNKGCTAHHLAALNGHTETLRVLLAIPGIKVNVKTNPDQTALDLATRKGHTPCQELLIENWAH